LPPMMLGRSIVSDLKPTSFISLSSSLVNAFVHERPLRDEVDDPSLSAKLIF
jgi:hypothetical protein